MEVPAPGTLISWKQARIQFHEMFATLLATNADVQQMLAKFIDNCEPLYTAVRNFAALWPGLYKNMTDDQIVQIITHDAGRVAKSGNHPELAAALSCFKIAHICLRNAKRNFLKENEITKAYRNNPNQIYGTNAVEKLSLNRLNVAYPPHGMWVCESKEIRDLWHYHLTHDPKADIRLPRHKPIVLNPKKIAKIIDPDVSCVVRDAATNEIILIVLRCCFDLEIGEWLDSIIEEATDTRRNIRKDDEGDLVMIGLSAGARSKPAFHWVRNLLRKHTQDQIDEFNKKQCSAFAFFWNWLRCHLHEEVMRNFDKWMEEQMLPRMTPEWQNLSKKGSYTVTSSGKSLTFNQVELAPPAGVMASNYARPMHYENQPHDYAVAFTARRNAAVTDGGHFYVASYGIKVEASANSIMVWRPKDVHGTSLQNRHPHDDDPSYIQRGLAIVTSSRLPKVWAKYVEQLGLDLGAADVAAKEAEKILYDPELGPDEFYA